MGMNPGLMWALQIAVGAIIGIPLVIHFVIIIYKFWEAFAKFSGLVG